MNETTTTRQMPYHKRVKWRTETFIRLGYSPKTARCKAYNLEALLKKMKNDVVELYVGADKANNKAATVLRATLAGNRRLQNLSPKRNTVTVVNADTGRQIELSICRTLEDLEIKQKKEPNESLIQLTIKSNLQFKQIINK